MDRSYRAEDLVIVYAKAGDSVPVGQFRAVPYSRHGLDYYLYEGKLYPGYVNGNTQTAFIYLDKPVPQVAGSYGPYYWGAVEGC